MNVHSCTTKGLVIACLLPSVMKGERTVSTFSKDRFVEGLAPVTG